MTVRTKGVAFTTGRLRNIGNASVRAMRRGVRVWLEMVAAESQAEVPRITGNLANSMRIAVKSSAPVLGDITYQAPYAALVHEIPRPAASNGKWKYLEDPFKRLEPRIEQTIADEVERAMKEAA